MNASLRKTCLFLSLSIVFITGHCKPNLEELSATPALKILPVKDPYEFNSKAEMIDGIRNGSFWDLLSANQFVGVLNPTQSYGELRFPNVYLTHEERDVPYPNQPLFKSVSKILYRDYGWLGDKNEFLPDDQHTLDRNFRNQFTAIALLNDPEYANNIEIKASYAKSLKTISKIVYSTYGAASEQFMNAYNALLNDFNDEWSSYAPATLASIKEQTILNAKQAELDRLQKAAQIDTKNRCLNSNENKLSDVANQLVIAQRTLESGNVVMEADKNAEHYSGVVNLRSRYVAGEAIARAKEAQKTLFPVYKRLGGVAATPVQVSLVKSPCT